MSPNLHESAPPIHNKAHRDPSIASKPEPTATTSPDQDADSIHSTSNSSPLHDIPTHVSHADHHTHEPIAPAPTTPDIPDEIYDRLSRPRKLAIIAVLSFCGFLTPVSSTTVLAAVPEVAATYGTTGSIINLSNAMYLICMGFSPCFWGPLSQVYGRRIICLTTAFLFTACSIGTAFAPNLAAFFIFRMLTAFEGTSFLIIGAACIGDIYRPTERGTAMGWFLSGTLIGPAIGPFVGGIIVTYTSWRAIFYLQTGLSAVGLIGSYFLLPETIHRKKSLDLAELPLQRRAGELWRMSNPWRVIKLWRYPNLVVVAFASSSLVWNMYSLLTPIRYVLNPRFGLTTPIQSGLFYLAPGCGYILGTFFGGRYADHIVKKYIIKRGQRVPEDRLRSALPFMGIVIPVCMLLYGWSVEKRFGGVALPVIMMFCQGVAQLFCFPSLNTYCLDVMQRDGAEVIAGNYLVRYMFAAAGSAVVLPAVQKMGVGWFSTVSAGFLAASALATWAAVVWGKGWREGIDARKKARRGEKLERESGEGEKGVKEVV